jgi:hypothetical protein
VVEIADEEHPAWAVPGREGAFLDEVMQSQQGSGARGSLMSEVKDKRNPVSPALL